jgi:hypothetical protein
MGALYLTEMADWFRAAGLDVVEYDGWKTRSRSSGGYESGRPWGVMWHHTASSTSPENDANYMCHGSSDRPIANLLVARDGAIWVLGAGATNTNGKGSGVVWSRGRVPDDSMNTYAVGMEIANSGVGEAYPQAQIDSAFAASVAIVQHLGLAATDVAEHYTWARTRKIDPATASAVQGPWQPASCTSSGTWELNDLIAEHANRCGAGPSPTPPQPTPPTPTPDDDEDDMLFDGFWQRDNDSAVFAIYKDGHKLWVPNDGDLAAWQALMAINGATPEQTSIRIQTDPCMFTAFGLVEGPLPNDGVHRDEYGNVV